MNPDIVWALLLVAAYVGYAWFLRWLSEDTGITVRESEWRTERDDRPVYDAMERGR